MIFTKMKILRISGLCWNSGSLITHCSQWLLSDFFFHCKKDVFVASWGYTIVRHKCLDVERLG